MSQPDFQDNGADDAPLDPATLRVQAKLKRLLLGSSLIMFAGFIAVFAAILYKINTYEAPLDEIPFAAEIAVGANADVRQVTVTDGIMFVLVREGEQSVLLRFDAETGTALGRTEFVAN
ncbi:hypothetical protein E1180_14650 [Roseibium denhamense]|uniref:Fimbrial protein n=1 Tax=Roseibium denhamense TaxID=76305 RepID=A0ABY1NJJ6_9HYPH|nr:hypothetical protein [Roseibium denhamense]MTI06753.1 hypothetical protein [Roseibium denhamense]SMP11018.1 hypothetical protein SAMN06265374_1278 [Roseibium denhamense]